MPTSPRAEPYRRARLGLGYVPQGREIFPGLTVLDNLRMGCATQGGAEADIIAPILEDFPRLKSAARPPRRRAVRRRAAIAGDGALPLRRAAPGAARRADRGHPALDHRRDRRDAAAAAASSGLTMILVEQNLDFIAALSQRILIIQKGTITREVAPGDLADPEPGRRIRRHRNLSRDHNGRHHGGDPDHGRQATHISTNCAASPKTSACT